MLSPEFFFLYLSSEPPSVSVNEDQKKGYRKRLMNCDEKRVEEEKIGKGKWEKYDHFLDIVGHLGNRKT